MDSGIRRNDDFFVGRNDDFFDGRNVENEDGIREAIHKFS